jgi:hypothetical protein
MHVTRVPVDVPGGSWLDGVRVRQATVRPLTGADEALLAENATTMLPVERTSALLGRCVTVDAVSLSGIELARRLSVGDREALLLHVRRLTFGDLLQCVLTCPNTECGERMDLDLSVAELLLPPYAESAPWYDGEDPTDRRALRFRIPTGGDQEAAAALARSDRAAAAAELARRCVMRADQRDDEATSEGTHGAIAAAMLERDPQAEIALDVTCPVCGHDASTFLDAGSFLLQEILAGQPRLYREVHTLALHYHWSESEILGLTRPQRQRYLDLLAESTAGAKG